MVQAGNVVVHNQKKGGLYYVEHGRTVWENLVKTQFSST